jgi:hypothetical protein
MTDPATLLAPGEVAGELGVHINTVYRYIADDLLAATWQGGWRVSRSALEDFKREAARRKRETGRIR